MHARIALLCVYKIIPHRGYFHDEQINIIYKIYHVQCVNDYNDYYGLLLGINESRPICRCYIIICYICSCNQDSIITIDASIDT